MLHRYRTAFLMLLAAVLLLGVTLAKGNTLPWWQFDAFIVISVALGLWSQMIYFNVRLNNLNVKWNMKVVQFNMAGLTLPEYLEDDLDDIKAGRFTNTQLAIVGTGLTAVSLFYMIARHNKWGATWHGFNVILITIFICVCIAILIASAGWYQDQSFRIPMRFFWASLMGMIICVMLGIYMTEPMERGGPTAYQSDTGARQTQTQQYDYTQTRAHYYYINTWSGTSARSSGSSVSAPKCSGKGCNAYAFLLLILLVLALIICSALIAHFWVLAGSLLVTIMVMYTIHEIRVMDYRRLRARSQRMTDSW
ncbi:hypothetical protein BH09PAT2_BH09PAT2_04530 [soil metagenome]